MSPRLIPLPNRFHRSPRSSSSLSVELTLYLYRLDDDDEYISNMPQANYGMSYLFHLYYLQCLNILQLSTTTNSEQSILESADRVLHAAPEHRLNGAKLKLMAERHDTRHCPSSPTRLKILRAGKEYDY